MNTNINDHSEKDVFVEKRIFLVGFFWSVLDKYLIELGIVILLV